MARNEILKPFGIWGTGIELAKEHFALLAHFFAGGRAPAAGARGRGRPRLLRLCHVGQEDIARFVVDGCEALPGFEAVANAQKVDVAKVQPHVVALVKKHLKANPKIRAVLLECTELPPYADAIRHDTGLLVLDVITLIDYFLAAVSPNPYYGIDWQKLAATPAKD